MNAAVYVVEGAFSAALVFVGLVFLRGVGIDGVARYVLAFVTGALVYVAALVLLVATDLPSTPSVALLVGLFVAVAVRLATRGRRFHGLAAGFGTRVGLLRDGAVSLGVAVLVAIALPAVDRVTYIKHVDSFEYIAISGMLTARSLDEGVSLFQFQKRQLVVPALHAPARYADAFYLRSVSPAIAVSTLLFMVFVVASARTGRSAAPPWPWSAAVALVGVALLVTHNRFVMHAFYVNGHLFYALLSLVVAGAAWLVARRSVAAVAGWSTVAGLAMAVLQVTRVEAFLLSTALLLAVLTSTRIPILFKATTLAGYGLGVVVWHGYLVRLGVSGTDVLGPLGVGILSLVVLATLRRTEPLLVSYGRWLRTLYVAGLLAVLGVLVLQAPAIMRDSWSAFIENAVTFDGYWGVGLLSLAAVTLLAALLLRDRDRVLIGLPIIAFLPHAFLIAYLRDAAYRVGGGDSLNRMLIQVVPLMVMFVVVSLQAVHSRGVPLGSTAAVDDAREVPTP